MNPQTEQPKIRIFKLNDCDWYMAPSIEEAIAYALKETGNAYDDYIENPREVTEEELDTLAYTEEISQPGPMFPNKQVATRIKRTFREQLEREIAAGRTTYIFASTEY